MVDRRTYGVEVILDSDISKHPLCPHGPTLLFERFSKDKDNERKFYACSASRDRKECGFFRYIDDKKAMSSDVGRKSIKLSLARDEYAKRLKTFKELPEKSRKFCQRCSKLLLPNETKAHTSHGFLETIPNQKLSNPSMLLRPKETNKSNAQYFFTNKTVEFTLDILERFEIQRVICIGAPTIHDSISNRECSGLKSLLLDIDGRFAQFYDEKQYCQYNLFNHHFFDENSIAIFSEFISSAEKTALILDPPFGGLIDAISHTLKKLINLRETENKSTLNILWFFPYFNEDRIIRNLPVLKMMDYKVDYENHASFNSKGRKQGSPVRIFTNLDPSKFVLPQSEGYNFCDKCQRYVAKENVHCSKCDSCTSKDGRPYKHCLSCGICVKSSKNHCQACNHCVLPNHVCGEVTESTSCHRCGQEGHKRTECTFKDQSKQTNASSKRKKIKRKQK